MLTKFPEPAGVEVMVPHLVHLFAPNFYKGTMLNLHHYRVKCLVVNMDDKASRQFWLDFFYVRIEDANVDGLPVA